MNRWWFEEQMMNQPVLPTGTWGRVLSSMIFAVLLMDADPGLTEAMKCDFMYDIVYKDFSIQSQ